MLPAARIQAAIEIIDEMLAAWGEGRNLPAEHALKQYVRTRRYIGGGDRRAISAIFYEAMRSQGLARWWLDKFEYELDGRGWMLWHLQSKNQLADALPGFGANNYAPVVLNEAEIEWLEACAHSEAKPSPAAQANMPQWLYDALHTRFAETTETELAAMQQRAALVLRVNTLKATRDEVLNELRSLGIEATPTPFSPLGIQVPERLRLEDVAAYLDGRVELQDESSQLAVLSLGVKPGMRVVDLGAGAGGKALALAAEMQNQGAIFAVDVDARRMNDILPRIERAGATIIKPHLLEEGKPLPKAWEGTMDAVMIDAPCSGIGTLRRHPDASWRLSPEQIEMLQRTQIDLMAQAKRLLKPDGKLLYATCSLLESENEAVINQFINEKLMLKLAPAPQLWNNLIQAQESRRVGLTLTPHRHRTDGFFMALLQA